MNRIYALSRAKRLCRQLRNRLYRVPDGEEIEFMDQHKPWASAHKDSLPEDFAEQWRSVRQILYLSIEKYRQAQNMSHGRPRYQLTSEVADLRDDCWRVIKEIANEIQQDLIEVP